MAKPGLSYDRTKRSWRFAVPFRMITRRAVDSGLSNALGAAM